MIAHENHPARGICLRLPTLLLLLCIGNAALPVCAQDFNYLFKAGDFGYRCFRIPAIIRTNSGAVLAFAEARRGNCGDAGDIDLVMRRSTDGGQTWSSQSVVWDDADNTCGNPAPVVDRNTGKVLLLSTWNLGSDHEPAIIDGTSQDSRRVFLLESSDEGLTWSTPREVTSEVKKADWTWYATGPGNGIQMESGPHKGRLVIPCDHIESVTKRYYSHVVYSDDGGKTWKLGGTTPTDQVNECAVAELPKGRLLLNMRNYDGVRYRRTSISEDGGDSWLPLKQDTALPEPVCQASLIRHIPLKGRPFLAFSNPADRKARVNMTVRLSFDHGRTWKERLVLHTGPSAYSNLVSLPNGNLACLYEAGIRNPYEGIAFREIRRSEFK